MGTHVLVPVDGSAQSEKAFEYVLDTIAEPRITLIHVINPTTVMGFGDDEYFDVEAYHEEIQRRRKRNEAMLEEYRERAAERGIQVETILTTGKPAKRILEAVESDGIDHIVMGSRGRSGVGRVLFGSVAETVTRRASVPVTIIR